MELEGSVEDGWGNGSGAGGRVRGSSVDQRLEVTTNWELWGSGQLVSLKEGRMARIAPRESQWKNKNSDEGLNRKGRVGGR